MARLNVEGVDLSKWREAIKAALAAAPGVVSVEVESADETVEAEAAHDGGPALEEASRFYLRGQDGERVPVEQLQFFVLRALMKYGITRGGKALAQFVLLDSGLDVAPKSLSSAYSRLHPVMDAAGYPLVRRHGVYGFETAAARSKQGRGSLRRRSLAEEI